MKPANNTWDYDNEEAGIEKKANINSVGVFGVMGVRLRYVTAIEAQRKRNTVVLLLLITVLVAVYFFHLNLVHQRTNSQLVSIIHNNLNFPESTKATNATDDSSGDMTVNISFHLHNTIN